VKSSFAQARTPAERPKRILLAEDDSAFRALLVDVLRADGHQVVEVSDGQELLEKIASAITDGSELDGIDLIVSDNRMPRFHALDVAAALHKASIEVPMLLMTAFGDRNTHQQAQLLGVLGVLDKPFEVDALRTTVCDILFGHIVGAARPANEQEEAP
jgi:CheY-like chemotaxis protein